MQIYLSYNTLHQKVEKITFDFHKFTNYACSKKITNPATLTYECTIIPEQPDSKISKLHPAEHFENSSIFCTLADQHRHSKADVSVSNALITETISRTSNVDYFKTKLDDFYTW